VVGQRARALQGAGARGGGGGGAGGTLFASGTPDTAGGGGAGGAVDDYWSAVEGAKGGELWAVSAADGKKLESLKLESPPVYDGMSAALGRLYISTADGKLRCFGGR